MNDSAATEGQRAPDEALLRRLRGSEEQLRLIVESARDYAIFTTDADHMITNWLPGAENVFGWTKEEAEGQPADITFTPEDRRIGEPRKEVEVARREGKSPDVRWHQRKDGKRVFIEGQMVRMRDERGEITGYLKIGQDITARKFAEDALRESEERLRQFGEASSDLLWIRDAETLAFEYLSPAFERLYGVPREQVLEANNVEAWLELIHPDDRHQAVETLRKLKDGIPDTFEFRIVRPDGSVRWIHDTDFPLRDEFGRVVRIAGIAQDVTERRRAQQMQQTLVAELQHRVRNILAITRSIIRRTVAGKADIDDFVQHLEGRVDALARTQALLTRSPGSAVDLEEIIRDEMLAQAAREPKFSVSGERVNLQAQAAAVLTLAVHELATNSVKYGALAEDRGKIRINWKREREKGEDWLKLRWSESGVEVNGTAAREGFGTELITRRVPYELRGRGEMNFKKTGVTAVIEFPLKEIAYSNRARRRFWRRLNERSYRSRGGRCSS
jgi:PAS domain S-box-containing protein